jgi:hypothetical protein
VQRLAIEGPQDRLALAPELAGLGLEVGAIDGIAHQRVAEMSEVNPDLMGPAGLEPAGHKRRDRLAVVTAENFPHFIMGDRLTAARAHGHLFARVGMTVDRRIDGAARPVRRAPDKGEIAALHRPGPAVVGKLRCERLMGAVVLGRDHQPRSVLVQAVHDTGPFHPTDPRQARAAMGDQRIHQCSGCVPGARVHHKPRRLVDDDDVVVLIDDVKLNSAADRRSTLGTGRIPEINSGGARPHHAVRRPANDARTAAAVKGCTRAVTRNWSHHGMAQLDETNGA